MAWDQKCAYCEKSDPRTLDHVVPKSKGGMTVRANLIPSCGDCNLKKSNMTWMLFFRQQEFWTLEREQNILNWVNKDHSYIETAKEYETLCKEPLLLPALEDAA